MHLVPAEHRHRRMIDEEKVCEAIGAVRDPEALRRSAQRFSLLADPTRLRLLVCIQAAGPISVSDLAVAAGLTDDHVSQALRHLRAANAVGSERDGKVVRYRITDGAVAGLLATLDR